MSQKKIKRLRKEDTSKIKTVFMEKMPGIREILKKNWLFLLILIIATFLVYLNSLSGDFVSDDYASITQNPNIMDLGLSLKSKSLPGITNSILARIFGIESSVAYHFFNLSLYFLILVAAFIFIFLTTNNKLISMFTLSIFSVMPVHVESISWISGRPYLLVALFVFTSLDLIILFLNKKQKKYLWPLIPILLLLFFTDRIRGFSLVILGFLYILTFKDKLAYKIKIGKILLVIALITIILGIISWPLINNRIFSVNSGINASDSIFYNPFFQYPTAITKYLQLLLIPVDLTLYHTMYIVPVWLNWAVLITYLIVVGWFWFKNKKVFFALVFIFAATAPSMAPVKVSWLVAERYIFMGSLGLALLMGMFFEKIWHKYKIISVVCLSIIIALYGWKTFLRNIDWQTNHKLWVNTCQVSPNSHNAWNNIGDDYDKLAQLETDDSKRQIHFENAIKGFGQSFAIKPNYADAYHNQANILYKIGRLDLAREAYKIALFYNPNLLQTYMTLVQLDIAEMNKEELIKNINSLMKLKPNDLQIYYLAAAAFAKIGMISESKEITNVLYQQFPNIPEIKDLYNYLNSLEISNNSLPITKN